PWPPEGVACGKGPAGPAEGVNIAGSGTTPGGKLQSERRDGTAGQAAGGAGDDFGGTGDIGTNGGAGCRVRSPGEILIEGRCNMQACRLYIKTGRIQHGMNGAHW